MYQSKDTSSHHSFLTVKIIQTNTKKIINPTIIQRFRDQFLIFIDNIKLFNKTKSYLYTNVT